MTTYIILNSCHSVPSQDCFDSQKAISVDLALAVVSLVIGILGVTSVIAMPPAASYALMSLSGFLVIADVIKYTVDLSNKKESVISAAAKGKIKSSEHQAPKSKRKVLKGASEEGKKKKPISKAQTSGQQKIQEDKKKLTAPQLPTSYYTISQEGALSLDYWPRNAPGHDKRPSTTQSSVRHPFPVAASPEHGNRFSVAGVIRQHIIFDDGTVVNHMDFQFQAEATFMKPNVDTMLMCQGLHVLLQGNPNFTQAIDVGAGSGFISKYLALQNPNGCVTAIDIDPQAGKYMHSAEAEMPPNVQIQVEDAITHLSQRGGHYDLIVSNPPYVPTTGETESDEKVAIKHPSFWKGTGMMSYMLEDSLLKLPEGGHLVMVVPSTALKSKRLAKIFQNYASNYQARILHQQEVAYKAWYAGRGKVDHLLATQQERTQPTFFKGVKLPLFVGITKPGQPRECQVEDGRREYNGYFWQMVYIIDFSKKQEVT
jgi:methylase of polypeptide subunit release factors